MADSDNQFRAVMELVRNGSEEAARELVATYFDELRRAVRRVLNRKLRPQFDSLDFVQMVWKSFFARPAAAPCDSPAQLAAFLIGIARHKVLTEARRLEATDHDVKRERALDDSVDGARRADGRQEPLPIDVAIAHERLERFLKDRVERYREIIRLRVAGHSCSAIAAELHLDERTVRRFLKKLSTEQKD